MEGFNDFLEGLGNAADKVIQRILDFRALELVSDAQAFNPPPAPAPAATSAGNTADIAILILGGVLAFLVAKELIK